jgi:hypothetical protein
MLRSKEDLTPGSYLPLNPPHSRRRIRRAQSFNRPSSRIQRLILPLVRVWAAPSTQGIHYVDQIRVCAAPSAYHFHSSSAQVVAQVVLRYQSSGSTPTAEQSKSPKSGPEGDSRSFSTAPGPESTRSDAGQHKVSINISKPVRETLQESSDLLAELSTHI